MKDDKYKKKGTNIKVILDEGIYISDNYVVLVYPNIDLFLSD
jgi:hypothetical protein